MSLAAFGGSARQLRWVFVDRRHSLLFPEVKGSSLTSVDVCIMGRMGDNSALIQEMTRSQDRAIEWWVTEDSFDRELRHLMDQQLVREQ